MENRPFVISDWQKKHNDTEQRKDDIRNRIQTAARQNQEQARLFYRPANPSPTLEDAEEKGVAVYARVSTSSEEQISSIENQTLYYEKKIADKPNWKLQKIYSDEGKSGTSMRRREAFKRMIADAKAKKMDLIICASVSRFARNVSDCLDQVRELKTSDPSHPVGVYFETENLYSLNPDCEQALGIHALLADWESSNKSRRMVLSYDQRILTGQYPVADLLGYRHTRDGKLLVEKEEAKTVRFIFLAVILGYSIKEIAGILTQKKRPTLHGRTDWTSNMVISVMKNERRWGELEARKSIVTDYKLGKIVKNHGERCSAYVPSHHEAIVSPEIARAAHFVLRSGRAGSGGLVELNVIDHGILKGFVSVNPSLAGIDHDAYLSLCKSAYGQSEAEFLYEGSGINCGNEQGNTELMGADGYRVPSGIGYLTASMPSLTFSSDSITFNSAAFHRLDDCCYIELYYHPVLRALFVRKAKAEDASSVEWMRKDEKQARTIVAESFCRAVYQNMNWNKERRFRLRGITKKRDEKKIMFFFLDESEQISAQKVKENVNSVTDPPSEAVNMPYSRHAGAVESKPILNRVTVEDIRIAGSIRDNPLIGHIPEKNQLKIELEELMKSM